MRNRYTRNMDIIYGLLALALWFLAIKLKLGFIFFKTRIMVYVLLPVIGVMLIGSGLGLW